MAKTVAMLQSNYIPWRGYFDIMRRCDVFVICDTVQYTTRDWRNRNSIKKPTGKHWLTIPVQKAPQGTTMIDEVRAVGPSWVKNHIQNLSHYYCRASAYRETSSWLFDLLESAAEEELLSRINTRLLIAIAAHLGISTPIVHSTQLVSRETQNALDKNMRVIAICEAAGATCYLSGPAAKVYLDEALFNSHGINVAWMSYENYPPYPQLWGAFEPNLSIVDLLLNTGARAGEYLPPLAERGRYSPAPQSATAAVRP